MFVFHFLTIPLFNFTLLVSQIEILNNTEKSLPSNFFKHLNPLADREALLQRGTPSENELRSKVSGAFFSSSEYVRLLTRLNRQVSLGRFGEISL